MDAGRHPRIELLVNSEVEDITGFVGNYRARIRRRAQHVDPVDCTACGDCVEVCPVALPDEYQEGLATRKAIYMPFPQAVPATYTLDADNCLGFNPIACGKCLEACDKKCIDYDVTDELRDIEIGSVVVATGMDVYDPRGTDEYGYCRFPDVITSMEFERLINAGGPTEGELVRPSDRQVPKRIGFIQCVGSRSPNRGVPYCSNFCCMNTIKETLLLTEHFPDSRSTVFHQDIRAFGKGFEDLYSRSREEGVHFVRGLPGAVEQDEGTGELLVRVEDTLRGEIIEHRLDMVVLAVGMVPRKLNGNARPGQRSIDEILSLSHTSDGFVMEAHPKLKPVDAPTRGVYFAGCVESPKDVKDSVTQAGAAASRAGNLLGAGEVKIEAITAVLDSNLCAQCKICAQVCPFNAIEEANKKNKQDPLFIEAACAGCGDLRRRVPVRRHHHASLRGPASGRSDRLHPGRPADGEDRRLRLQLVLLRGRRCRRHLTAAVPAHRAADPHHVQRPGGPEVYLARLPTGGAAGPGLRLPLLRLPLHRRRDLDPETRREGLVSDGEARHPAGAPATRVDQRRRRPEVRSRHARGRQAAARGHTAGGRRDHQDPREERTGDGSRPRHGSGGRRVGSAGSDQLRTEVDDG